MSDLLKEAIADAKAVRETALQNAKMALQEAFTPQLKSMLSAKLREDDDEFEDEEEFGGEEVPEVPGDEFGGEEEIPVAPEAEPVVAQDEVPGLEVPGEVPGEERDLLRPPPYAVGGGEQTGGGDAGGGDARGRDGAGSG